MGLRVERLGTSSVTYTVGIFQARYVNAESPPTAKEDPSLLAAAIGTMTHVYVDPKTKKPVTIPPLAQEAFKALLEKPAC